MYLRILLPGFLVLVALVSGCNLKQDSASSGDDLFFDYRITGEENDDVACVFQFRREGAEGEAVAVKDPGTVELDGKRLEDNSAGFTGIYYKHYTPAEEFIGRHTIVYKSPGKKIYTEEFEFEPFKVEEIPEEV